MKGYTTKEEIENYLLIDIDDSFDTQVEKWISAIERYIDHVTNRDWSAVSDESGYEGEEKLFDGDKTNTLLVPAFVGDVSIKLTPTSTALASTEYVLYPANEAVKTKIVLKNKKFPRGMQNISVTADWGYEEVPEDITFAATVLVAGIINNAWQSEGEIQSMTIGRYQVTYKTEEQVNDFKRVGEILGFNKKYTF